MMMKSKKKTGKNGIKMHIYTLLCAFLLWPALLLADPPDPPPLPGTHGQNGDAPVGAPIDGGVGILLALGAAYGGVRLWKGRKDTSEPVD